MNTTGFRNLGTAETFTNNINIREVLFGNIITRDKTDFLHK